MQEALLELFRESYRLRVSLMHQHTTHPYRDRRSLRMQGEADAHHLSRQTGVPMQLFLEELDRVLPFSSCFEEEDGE